MAGPRNKAIIIDPTHQAAERLRPALARAGIELETAEDAGAADNTLQLAIVAGDAGMQDLHARLDGTNAAPLIVRLAAQNGSDGAPVHCDSAETLARLLELGVPSGASQASLAHDLRNVLAPMRAALAILERADPQSTAGGAALAMLNKQVTALNERINQLCPTPGSTPRPVTSAPLPPSGRRILIADDSSAVQDAMGALLRSRGHTVRSAADGETALELAIAWQPDVVLADMRMPRLDGMGLARQLRGRFARGQMKLILMSGLTLDPVLIRHALAAGFDVCIDKVAPPEQWFSEIGSA